MNRKFLIWSIEHAAWWRPDSNGYTDNKAEAGRYSLEKAIAICICGNYAPEAANIPNEAMVPESDDEE